VWALAARGEAGVAHVLKVMTADIDVALGLIGATSIAEIDRSVLYRDVGSIAPQEIAGPVPGPVPAPPI